MAAATKARSGERTEKSQTIHARLDAAAEAINASHARVLSDVIEAQAWKIHRDIDGFSALREWLVEQFDFHANVAADLAAIARCARKFAVLAGAATSGAARVDRVAYAVRRLERTPAMRLHARTPYREAVTSPFNPETVCPTPEHLISQYCTHAPFGDLKAHLAELEADLAEHAEILEGLSEESLQRLEVWQQDNGMWVLDGLLAADSGAMLDKLLKTAVPPPRQDQTDTDGVLPAAANRNAEALHQLIAAYGTDPHAPTRHGHTATLNLTVDIATLQGKDTGRTPTLEGQPISLAKARLLACEAAVIPSVFDYSSGEAVELGRAKRLPNAALRRKLELEQPGGCAWSGCDRPVAWCEAHHIQPWYQGGPTVAENLVLLCRFHHGRVHTPGWTVTKTGPGQAVIVHHDGHEPTPADMQETGAGCGCADWRTPTDLETDFENDVANVFPTGLFPDEWGPGLKDDLNRAAEAIEYERIEAEIKAARARLRAKFAAPAPAPAPAPALESDRTAEPATGNEGGTGPEAHRDPDRRPEHASLPVPVLGRPARGAPCRGKRSYDAPLESREGSSPPACPGTEPAPNRTPPGNRKHPTRTQTPHETVTIGPAPTGRG